MNAPEPMTHCPSEETLAAFVDGRLDPEARRKVVEHMASCGECLSNFQTTSEFLASEGSAGNITSGGTVTRFSPRVYITAATVLAAAAVVIVLFGPMIRERLFPAKTGIEALVDASEGVRYRRTLARVSGGFPYRPERPTLRDSKGSDELDDSGKWRLLAAAARIEEDASRNPSVADLHALGVAYITTGETSKAIATFEKALRQETGEASIMRAITLSKRPALLNDLVAAYYTDLLRNDALGVQARAVEAAKAAWELEKTPEIAWNRALIMESLHIRETAQEAWRDYLKLDPVSDWSKEAKKRLERVSQPTEAERWPAARDRLSVMPPDPAAMLPIVGDFRQQVRFWCEDGLLPAWGEAELKHDAAADAILTRAGALAKALEMSSGEQSTRRAVDAIRAASPRDTALLAGGHSAYGAGRHAILESNAADSLRHMSAAVRMLPPSLTPFAVRARTEEAAAMYSLNDYENALDRFQQLLQHEVPGDMVSFVIPGRIHWAAGVANSLIGHPARAAEHYELALQQFSRAGERDHEAMQHCLLADITVTLGKAEKARWHRRRALELLEETGHAERRHVVVFEAAYAAIVDDQPALAGILLDNVVAHDLSRKNAIGACTSLMWRSAYRSTQHETVLAQNDLTQARAACGSIPDPAVRERSLANVALAEAIVNRATGVADLPQLDTAIAYFEKSRSRIWLRTAYLTRARAFAEADDLASAERDFRAAIAVDESERNEIKEWETRVSFAATADDVVDAYVGFLLDQGRTREAFEVADGSRARELVDSPSAKWRLESGKSSIVDDLQVRLPSHTALVEYRVVGERIVGWVIQNATFNVITVPGSIRDIRQLLEDLDAEASSQQWEASAALLHGKLLGPLAAVLDQSSILIVVPDDEIERVPFAALYDRRRRHYVAEAAATVVVPSAALYIESAARFELRAAATERVVVVSASASGQKSEALPVAASEGDAIAGFFPATSVSRAATPAEFLEVAANATIIHFGGHTAPENSDAAPRSLLLGGDEEARVSIPAVIASRLTHLRLAYLAACATDVGPIMKSEGSLTLARAFFAAGVPVVIGTLWSVDDAIAGEMTTLFYSHLRNGWSPAEALRRSQVALLSRHADGRRDWAAFRVIGGGVGSKKGSERREDRNVKNSRSEIQRYLHAGTRVSEKG